MRLSIGQKVAYPNQGVCLIEDIERKKIGEILMEFFAAAYSQHRKSPP
jgi:RNA polymerase-interacting CarD/CdnL/TRCF family regulator